MRILNSLPRTHKLLLLPVATMVTVLGAHKILTSIEDAHQDGQRQDTVLVPLGEDASPGVPSLALDRAPVAEAIALASRAKDATQDAIPLSQLKPSEIVDVSFAKAAHADVDVDTSDAPQLDDAARHLAIVIGTVASGMLNDDERVVADATSYENVSSDELELFDDGPIVLDQEIDAEEPYVPEWLTYTVESGDTFALMAQNTLGLGYSEVTALLDKLPEPELLTRWRAGDHFEYQLDEQGKLLSLRLMKNARDGYLIDHDDDGQLEVATIERAGEATQRLYAGTVSGSFARSAQATGLNSAEVAELSHVLEKKLDFRRDTRRGDRFSVLVESDIIDGESLDPRVLAVSYEGSRMDLTLVRNAEDNRFYTPNGESLDPAFDRYPFTGHYRISSSFNLHRRHPVTGRISPHKGTDFAMPSGTPVDAPADGRVVRVGNHPLAGRYIVIQQDNGYKTRFLHLSKPMVSRGDRVTRGEEIGLSGSTGRVTGPHLHYEILVNNTQVNAMTVDLPQSKSLSGDALVAFKQEAQPMLAALQSGETGTTSVASTDTQPADASDDES
ncbi:peptidoglycan DD-metalloendopeptidase family protein [Halomonas getboli]|uniref:peptidoglycan DD-metalloendopeptidase family protein n=1 Tax=Halomonas getboli TaxID=2935862 RepID=UPI001FFF24D4|nr:peptidoglycan DD-metalloendopeptidase family protein [Halomonas getboli]MCK2184247.1 peptidoglycan DD-metalloendopeptidase family protein [Halomonas getboli]